MTDIRAAGNAPGLKTGLWAQEKMKPFQAPALHEQSMVQDVFFGRRKFDVHETESIRKIREAAAKYPALKVSPGRIIDGGKYGKVHSYELYNPEKPDSKPMRVLVLPMPGTKLVSAGVHIDRGSNSETPDISGFFHRWEHELFQGSLDGEGNVIFDPKQYPSEMEETTAEINAYTNFENTFYHFNHSPSEYTEHNLMRLAAMIQHPAAFPNMVESEHDTVLGEIDQYNDEPLDRLENRAAMDLYGAHPFSRPILGYKETVSALTSEKMHELHYKNYGLARRTLVVVGDVKPDQVAKLAARTFNIALDKFDDDYVPPAPAAIPVRESVIQRRFNEPGIPPNQAIAFWKYLGPDPSNMQESFAWSILSTLMMGSKISYGQQEIVNRDRLADRVGGWVSDPKPGSPATLTCRVFTSPGKLAATIAKMRILEERIKNPLPAEDVELAKASLRNSYVTDMQGQVKPMEILESMHKTDVLNLWGENYLRELDKITPEMVRAVARKYLVPGRKLEYEILPRTPETPADTPSLGTPEYRNVQTLRFGGRAEKYHILKKLEGGAKLTIDNRALPGRTRAALTLHLPGGRRLERYPGETRVLLQMLTAMNRKQDRTGIAKFQVLEGVNFTNLSQIGPDDLLIQVVGNPEQRAAMFTMMENTLMRPNFAASELDFEKRVFHARLQQQVQSQTDMETLREHTAYMYPEGHPYRMITDKHFEAAAPHITSKRLKELHASLFQPQRMTFDWIGEADAEEITASLNKITGTLARKASASRLAPIPTPRPVLSENRLQTHFREDGAEQTHIYRSYPMPVGSKSKKMAALRALESMLSGMSGPLFNAFRGEELRYGYTAYGNMTPYLDQNRFTIFVGTEHPLLYKALDRLDRFIGDYTKSEHSENERKEMERLLKMTKDTLRTGKRVKNMFAAGPSAGTAIHRGLKIPSDTEISRAIERLTVDDIIATARELFSQPALTTVGTTREAAEKFWLPAGGDMPYEEWKASAKDLPDPPATENNS